MKKLLLCGLSLIIILSCTQNTKRFEGKIIQIDYSKVKTIKDSSWIKIDNWKLRHFQSAKEAQEHEFSLPATYVVFDSTGNRSLGSRINGHGMGLYIAKNLNYINHKKLDPTQAKYKIINPPLISTHGILKVTKSDSSNISVEVPLTYPAKVQVLHK